MENLTRVRTGGRWSRLLLALVALLLLAREPAVSSSRPTGDRSQAPGAARPHQRWYPARPPWVIAHRGASEPAPENTMAAFELAAREGADAVELDVRTTKDRTLVALHDATVDRTSNGHGAIAAMTFDEVRRLDFSNGKPAFHGAKIPSLAEVCRWARAKGVGMVVEAKTPYREDPGLGERIAAMLDATGLLDRTLIESFDEPALRRVLARWPRAKVALLSASPLPPADIRGCWAYLPDYRFVNSITLAALHGQGFRVCVWTADSPGAWRWLTSLAVDGIMTNAPGRLRRLLDGLGYRHRPWPGGSGAAAHSAP